ncbi:MAG: exosortase/archaeosortase family protein [Chloroflexota bacterium]|nr:exosortase/archaeosortase family protein [Chloroflexota bacterium]
MPTPQTNARLNAAIFFAILLLFLPTWLWLGEAWLSDPYYSHGPLVLLVSVYLAWTRRKVFTEVGSAPSNLGLLLVVAALAVHLWALLWRAYYLSALTIPLALFGLLVTLSGWQIARRFLFPLAFLIFMVPLPIAERVGPVLEGWTATSATAFAQFIGVAARNDGSQVFLPNSTFTVGIPCGGLRSVIAIVTLVTLWVYIVQGSAWARGLVFLAAVPIALAANTLRIALLFAIASAWGAEVGLDYFHSWSSPVLFLLAFALLLLLAKGLGASRVRWEVVAPA